MSHSTLAYRLTRVIENSVWSAVMQSLDSRSLIVCFGARRSCLGSVRPEKDASDHRTTHFHTCTGGLGLGFQAQ